MPNPLGLCLLGLACAAILCLPACAREKSSQGQLRDQNIAPLTGLPIADEDSFALQRPLAVIIDNIVEATPQSGLDRADIVIEALVEGGITRLLAIYQSRGADMIEPIRSTRTPFLHWVLEYNAIHVHAGVSAEPGPANAEQQIREWRIANLDLDVEGSWIEEKPYDRNPNREAPHNVVTSTQRLRREAGARKYEYEASIEPWQFQSNASTQMPGSPAASFIVTFGALSPFAPSWEWDAAGGVYVRSQFGAPHLDGHSGVRLAFPNVVVQYVETNVVSAKGHVLIDVIGEGRAQVFRSGEVVEARWRKSDSTLRTRFYGLDGAELSFVSGPTWIEVVDNSGGATIN